jgi:hypothetical protein
LATTIKCLCGGDKLFFIRVGWRCLNCEQEKYTLEGVDISSREAQEREFVRVDKAQERRLSERQQYALKQIPAGAAGLDLFNVSPIMISDCEMKDCHIEHANPHSDLPHGLPDIGPVQKPELQDALLVVQLVRPSAVKNGERLVLMEWALDPRRLNHLRANLPPGGVEVDKHTVLLDFHLHFSPNTMPKFHEAIPEASEHTCTELGHDMRFMFWKSECKRCGLTRSQILENRTACVPIRIQGETHAPDPLSVQTSPVVEHPRTEQDRPAPQASDRDRTQRAEKKQVPYWLETE